MELWNNTLFHTVIQERIMLRSNWYEVERTRDVVELLNMVDVCHGKLVDLNQDDATARVLANEAISNLKMRSGQSVADFKKDVKAAYELRARYNRQGEPDIDEAEKIIVFVNGLNSSHARFKHHYADNYADLPANKRPKNIDEVAALLAKYEADHERMYKSDYKGGRGQNQLAIHAVGKKEGKEKRVNKAKPTDKCGGCGGLGHWKRDGPTVAAAKEGAADASAEETKKIGCVKVEGDHVLQKYMIETTS